MVAGVFVSELKLNRQNCTQNCSPSNAGESLSKLAGVNLNDFMEDSKTFITCAHKRNQKESGVDFDECWKKKGSKRKGLAQEFLIHIP